MATTDGAPTTVAEAKQNKEDNEAEQNKSKQENEEIEVLDAMRRQTLESSRSPARGVCACCDHITRKINFAIENAFYKLGSAVGRCPCIVLILTLSVLILCMLGLANLQIVDDINDLWTPYDSPIWEENKFKDKYWSTGGGGNLVFIAESKTDADNGNILSVENLHEWYAFNLKLKTELPQIQYEWDNNGTAETLTFGLFYEDYYPVQNDLTVLGEYGADGKTVPHYVSKVIPFCEPSRFSPVEAQFQMPCGQLSMFDCFSEGGEFFPFENYLSMTMFQSFMPANVYTYMRSSFDGMDLTTLGEIIGESCPLFSGTRMPYNNLYGGETRIDPTNDSSPVTAIKTWETVILMDSLHGIAKKIKIATKQCKYTVSLTIECPETTDEDLDEAQDLYWKWLDLVIEWGVKQIEANDANDDKLLSITMWTDKSAADLLADAGSADFTLIFISYFAMVIFAALTAFRPNNLFLSKSEASCFGVMLVVFAVAGTLGLVGSFVKMVPEIANVVPFVAIGFGVDDMFILMFAYKYRERASVQEMVAETVRIAGSSVALTSLSNFAAFLISTQIPLPNVANFATFGTMVVVLNFVTVIFGFTAILALTARRQKGGYRDWAFSCCFADCTKYEANEEDTGTAVVGGASLSSAGSKAGMLAKQSRDPDTKSGRNTSGDAFEPIFNLLIKTPVRICCLLLSITLFLIGCIGIGSIEVGLPLQEIVPLDNYAGNFLRVRVEYYTTQSFTLYTDAVGGELTPIDWPNRFEDWLDTIHTIHEISPLVYDGMDVHSFWALGFQEYLQDTKVDAALTDAGYALGDAFVLEEDVIYASTFCEADRAKYCPAVGAEYFFGSPVFLCLYANENYIEADCFDYLFSLLPAEQFADYTWAHQLYITSFDEAHPNVTGLYVKSDSDTTNVFYKYPAYDGYIFQAEDSENCADGYCAWYFLDGAFNLLYIGDATTSDMDELFAIPSQNGWRDPVTLSAAKITQNYLDFGVAYSGQSRKLTNFIYWDVLPITVFHYSGKGEYEWKLMRKLMGSSTSFKSVTMGTFNNKVTCDAVLEATEICGAIRNGVSPGYINCGGIEQSAEDTNWWLGECNSGAEDAFYGIAATESITADITSGEACDCTDGLSLNHLSASIIEKDCFNPAEVISITCVQITECTDLSSCYEEFEEFTLDASGEYTECNITNLELFYEEYNLDASNVIEYASDLLAPCLFSYFDTLSDCCQSSIKSVLLADDVDFSCADIEGYISNINLTDAKEQVCNSKDRCLFDEDTNSCNNNCYDNVYADCSEFIFSSPWGTHGPQIETDYAALFAMADPDSCCRQSLDAAAAINNTQCIIPRAGYWDYSNLRYDYSVCDNASIAAINNSVCGTYYEPTDSFDMTYFPMNTLTGQLQCIYENIGTLPNGCCKNAIQQIASNSYVLSAECELDTETFCGSSFAVGMRNTSGTCFATIAGKAQVLGGLSPKCLFSFGFCPDIKGWPLTPGNTNASIACDAGYSGEQSRLCDNSAGFADWSSDIDSSACSLMSCEADIGPFQQFWPQTRINSIATVQGGYNPLDNSTQVGWRLQAVSIGGACNIANGTTYYARRKCELDQGSGTAVWNAPRVECRPAFAYDWSVAIPSTICDMLTDEGNMIGVIPWDWIMTFPDNTSEAIRQATLISYSQQYCESVLTNCVAFSYDSESRWAFFFDYCAATLTHSSWATMTTYIAPLSTAQFAAEFCSAMSAMAFAADPSGEVAFITAAEAWDDNGIPHPFCFNNLLWLYYIDPLGGVMTQSSIEFTLPYAQLNVSNTEILSTRNSFEIRKMDTDQDAVDTIISLRKTLEKWKEDELYVIPAGFVITFYSRYIGVHGYMVKNLIFVTIAVAGIGYMFLLNPIAVLVCICCNLMMIVEVYGFSHYVGLRVNGVLVLNIVVAIGLSMEFTAHIGRAFVLTTHSGSISLSEGQDRMRRTLKEMFVPVTLGAITTVIGIAPISAANWPYFKLYYFNLYVLIVVFGWLNGVIFQPIILSFYPPKSFDMDGKVSPVNTTGSNSTINKEEKAASHAEQQPSLELGTL